MEFIGFFHRHFALAKKVHFGFNFDFVFSFFCGFVARFGELSLRAHTLFAVLMRPARNSAKNCTEQKKVGGLQFSTCLVKA